MSDGFTTIIVQNKLNLAKGMYQFRLALGGPRCAIIAYVAKNYPELHIVRFAQP